MLSSFLSQIGLPVLIRLVARSLQTLNNPLARDAAEALDIVDQAIQAGQIAPEQLAEANRHVEKLAELESEEFQSNLAEINQSLRAEIASQDVYVRRMRPTFGYLMAFTWAAQMFGVAYVIMFDTAQAGLVLNAMGSLSAIWAVGLSVLGIYVYKRSEEKKIARPDQKGWIYHE